MKRYIRCNDQPREFEEIQLAMYGDYSCSCGCGNRLGRPTNGTDSKPIDYSYGVGLAGDDEGFDWRMFTKKCWDRIRKSGMSLEQIYDAYPPSYYEDYQRTAWY